MHTINKHTLMYTENQFSIEATENNLQKSCVKNMSCIYLWCLTCYQP